MIFTILKVIGIILLVVLALILTALLCVLFVPVKYRAVGSFDNTDIRAKAHVSWLFHLFALHIEYADETDGYIRLAFVKKKLLIIMRLWMMTIWMMQLKLKQKIKSVKTPEISLKYRQMSQNMSQMNRQRMKAHHRLIMSKGQ